MLQHVSEFLFFPEQRDPACVHAPSCFPSLVGGRLGCCGNELPLSLFESLLPILLHVYLEVKLLKDSHMVILSYVLRK